MKHLGIADRNERVMAFESLLELSRSIGPAIRIPKPDRLPPGPLQTTRLDSQLLKLGLATVDEFGYPDDEEDDIGRAVSGKDARGRSEERHEKQSERQSSTIQAHQPQG